MTLIVSHNPARPADILTETPATGRLGVLAAVERARAASRLWAQGGATSRAAALHAAAERVEQAGDELAALVVREVGKPITEARGEIARAVAILRYYAQQPYDPVGSVHEPAAGAGLLFTRRAPHGVAGLITPWNFPLAIPLWKAAPALATGNAVVLKPAPPATACALRLAELLDGVLPESVFTVVPGGAEEGMALVDGADVVSFTGSTAVGRAVVQAATASGTPVQAEMGGQNAALVLPDADVETTAAQLAAAIAGFAGQKCTATKRIIAVGDPGPLRDALINALHALRTGDPADPATVCGPLISAAARDAVLAAASGGRLLTGECARPDSTAGTPHRPSWTGSPRATCSPPKRSSGRSPRSARRPTWTRRSRGPEPWPTAWSRPCTPPTWTPPCAAPTGSPPAWSRSTPPPPASTSICPSAVRRPPATARASRARRPSTSTPGPAQSRCSPPHRYW